ncbi:MAG: Rne/Rng family ribonuclease [Emcibacter sp.]|nr:Rne/Rng family ribonuclease [Emcibacter sp.]
MLIDASHEEETRVAIVHGNRVEEFDYESSAKKQIKGNVYLAKITRVEPSLQAAFVDYGGNRHGFLAFSEIHPDYYQIPVSDREELIAEEAAAYAKLLNEDEEEIPEKKPKRKPRRKSKSNIDKKNNALEDSKKEDIKEEASKLNPETGPETGPETSSESISEINLESPEPPKYDASDNEIITSSVSTDDVTEEETHKIASPESEDDPEDDPENDSGSITKAEYVAASETISERVTSDDNSDDDLNNDMEDDTYDEDDATEIAGSDIIDDEEAEERLRIKIAKGLRRKYKIQEVIKKNQIILIQVVKEERGNKGAALTTYLSLPGRYCVLMPNTLHGGGVSRKIANVSERKSLKKILSALEMPSGIACIIRTAGQSRTKTEIKRDFDYLIRTWEGIRERTLKSVAPVLINEEGDLIKRSIRDLYTREVDEILVEGEKGYKTARSFMRLLMPSHARKIKHYTDPVPLLHKFQVESQLDAMYSPTAQLKSGGYIVINPTEALVSIDVNSGKATKEHNIEETARKTNLEAAEEIARQLRLRDMAGLIVIDFIDMENRGNNRAVEQKMKECLKSDRARIQVGRISSFGLMEMSRQRLRAGVLESSTTACPHCEGAGVIRSVESQVLHILRALEDEGIKSRNDKVSVHLPEKTAIYLLNNKRKKLVSLEEQYNFTIEIIIDSSLTESAYKLDAPNSDNKKFEKSGGGHQNKARETNQRTQGKNRSAQNRSNRQRDQSRKHKEKTENQSSDTSDDQKKTDDSAAVNPDSAPETTSPENQESKPRRRRRRPRRNHRDQADTASSSTEAASEPVSETNPEASSEASSKTSGEEKPKHSRRPRGGKKASEDNKSKTDAVDSPESSGDSAEKKTEEKPARRPYPPQARSRRNASGNKKASGPTAENTGAEPAAKSVKASPETSTDGSVKTEVKSAAPNKAAETEKTGPKKSGWWQRTFG